MAIIPFLNPPPTEPQSSQAAGSIYESPSTWQTLFALPWRSSEAPSHPIYGPTKAVDSVLFHMNGWSWFMLHYFLNPHKHATAGLREPPAPVSLPKWP